MSNRKREFLLVLVIVALVAAVSWIAVMKNDSSSGAAGAAPAAPLSSYTDQKYGIKVSYPYFMTATSTFSASYLLPDNWNVYADPGTGEEIVDIRYPDSNDILSAEVRIGASSAAKAVSSCFNLDPNIATSTRTINGTKFVYGSLSDAAMSHFSTVKSYRTIRAGVCFAVDEVTYGTNPEVYSPPRTVPFDQKLAQAALDAVVSSVIFTK